MTWECFPNNTKICTTRREDCSNCDGILSASILTCPSNVCKSEDPKTQAGRFRRPGPRRGRYRYKREVSGRRRPRIGRGEAKDSDKAVSDTEGGKEAETAVGINKTEEDTEKVNVMNLMLSK